MSAIPTLGVSWYSHMLMQELVYHINNTVEVTTKLLLKLSSVSLEELHIV